MSRRDRPNIRVVLLGKSNAGKTCLYRKFIDGTFATNKQETVGTLHGVKTVEVDGGQVNFELWDTDGRKTKPVSAASAYYKGAKAAIICYDVTRVRSYEEAKLWVTELKNKEESCEIYLTGTKRDLVETGSIKRVPLPEATEYAQENNISIIEISSKDGYNVEELFSRIARDDKNKQWPMERFEIDEGATQQEDSCCGCFSCSC